MSTVIKCAACMILKETVVRSFPADVVTYRGFSLCNKHASMWWSMSIGTTWEEFVEGAANTQSGPVKPGPNALGKQRQKMRDRIAEGDHVPQHVAEAMADAGLTEEEEEAMLTAEAERDAQPVVGSGGVSKKVLDQMVDVLEDKPKKKKGSKRRRRPKK